MNSLSLTYEKFKRWDRMPITEMQEIIDGVTCFLFDFDIPICHLFSNHPAYELAHRVKLYLAKIDLLKEEHLMELDPFVIFRDMQYLREHNVDVHMELEQEFTAWECTAAQSARPTEQATLLLTKLYEQKYPLAIVTNNSPKAVEIYLERMGISALLTGNIFGRSNANVELMKPNPAYLLDAIEYLHVKQEECLMIGDSITDFQAACGAGVSFLGFSNTSLKCAKLLHVGADNVIRSYDSLLEAINL